MNLQGNLEIFFVKILQIILQFIDFQNFNTNTIFYLFLGNIFCIKFGINKTIKMKKKKYIILALVLSNFFLIKAQSAIVSSGSDTSSSAGMVRGKRQAVDSVFIKANASMDSLIEKEVLEDASAFVNELEENSEFKTTSTRKKLVEQHHAWKEEAYRGMPNATGKDKVDEFGNIIRPKYLSNHTHYSPTDTDARVSVKPGKARQLNYFGQIAVDDAHHVITGACSDFADKRDSQCLEQIVELTEENLKENGIELEELLADGGYSSGEALAYLHEKNINAYIPNFGQYKSEREGFMFHKEENYYQCTKPEGNQAKLLFKGEKTDSKGYTKRTYRSSETDCKNCPLREPCCGKSTKFKKLDDSIHKEHYDRMHQKLTQNANYAKKMVRVRSKTVEPVIGTLVNFTNMKRVNTRGIKNANKHVLMASLTYNLKKYLRFITKKPSILAQVLSLKQGKNFAFVNQSSQASITQF